MNPGDQDAFQNRFQVARATLLLDRAMTAVIRSGGIMVMVAVFAIFLFIFLQILPLFGQPDIKPDGAVAIPLPDVEVMGVDEWGELPFFMTREGRLFFADLPRDPKTRAYDREEDGSIVPGPRGLFEVATGLPEKEWAVWYFDAYKGEIVLGSTDGRVAIVHVEFKAAFPEGAPRRIDPAVRSELLPAFGLEGRPVERVALYDSDDSRTVGILQRDEQDKPEVTLQTYAVRPSLFGPSTLSAGAVINATSLIPGETPDRLLLGGRGDRLLLTTRGGWVHYFRLVEGQLEAVQKLRPFADRADPEIASINWLLGKQSAILTGVDGANITLASYLDEESGRIIYDTIKTFPDVLPGGEPRFSASMRNRGFLIATDRQISLRYSTTENVRWSYEPSYTPRHARIGPRWDAIFVLDENSTLHRYQLDDPHPNAGARAFFGKIWYEGKPGPEFEWQSSSGTSDFEPKLSIVPLFFGSIKGTVYAMVFAFPIAVLAAIYSSQFLRPEAKRFIKPTMEIMASLPSVVLGFLAALWLAPLLEHRVPSVMVVLVLLPASAALLGALWQRLPRLLRTRIRPGSEWLVIIPMALVVGVIGWHLGPLLEAVAFRVYDPELDRTVGDFRRWWPEFTGADFEQRNSLVVGLMMGFAVIPIIFTISEDALSNVPPYLRSASLALGASRWQTTWRVILPTASPGIFSASIIGFGRAVGETMILVMATGNTPIMDWNIFNGMRTLAANIAVELPEAPQYSTLYRTLFLGAMVLFLLTFVINTIAEITRQHLREKYKTV